MAYTTDTFNLLCGGIDGQPSLWTYTSLDTYVEICVDGYIADGANKGLKASDIVIAVVTAAGAVVCTLHTATSATTIKSAFFD